MRILVITNCTNRKRTSSVAPSRAQDLCKGTVQEVANQWAQVLERQTVRKPLTDVYCGRGFSEALRAAKILDATFLVTSAGLGLVNALTSIPTYSATVTNGSNDNVIAKLTEGDAASWWEVINDVSPFSVPLATETFDLVLIAVSRPYFSLLRPTLEKLSETEKRKIRLFLSMSSDELPTSLRKLLMPYGSRFDHSSGPLPGTQSDFTQRAMRHFAALIVDSASHEDDVILHAQRVEVGRRMAEEFGASLRETKLKAQVRARVEHPFHVVKNIFRYKKTRYKGLAKNDAQLNVLFALSNLYMVREKLRP